MHGGFVTVTSFVYECVYTMFLNDYTCAQCHQIIMYLYTWLVHLF